MTFITYIFFRQIGESVYRFYENMANSHFEQEGKVEERFLQTVERLEHGLGQSINLGTRFGSLELELYKYNAMCSMVELTKNDEYLRQVYQALMAEIIQPQFQEINNGTASFETYQSYFTDANEWNHILDVVGSGDFVGVGVRKGFEYKKRAEIVNQIGLAPLTLTLTFLEILGIRGVQRYLAAIAGGDGTTTRSIVRFGFLFEQVLYRMTALVNNTLIVSNLYQEKTPSSINDLPQLRYISEEGELVSNNYLSYIEQTDLGGQNLPRRIVGLESRIRQGGVIPKDKNPEKTVLIPPLVFSKRAKHPINIENHAVSEEYDLFNIIVNLNKNDLFVEPRQKAMMLQKAIEYLSGFVFTNGLRLQELVVNKMPHTDGNNFLTQVALDGKMYMELLQAFNSSFVEFENAMSCSINRIGSVKEKPTFTKIYLPLLERAVGIQSMYGYDTMYAQVQASRDIASMAID
jgi:hypothetical protein